MRKFAVHPINSLVFSEFSKKIWQLRKLPVHYWPCSHLLVHVRKFLDMSEDSSHHIYSSLPRGLTSLSIPLLFSTGFLPPTTPHRRHLLPRLSGAPLHSNLGGLLEDYIACSPPGVHRTSGKRCQNRIPLTQLVKSVDFLRW